MASVGGIPQSKVNPKFLHSNSTSHVWVFGAVAELIDNAYDPDVNASQLFIDKQVIGGKECLVFQDNGNGMDKEHLYSML
ncbi:MORC family CW-type zinc finger protein 3, partial [Biomphalaria glabrata]